MSIYCTYKSKTITKIKIIEYIILTSTSMAKDLVKRAIVISPALFIGSRHHDSVTSGGSEVR